MMNKRIVNLVIHCAILVLITAFCNIAYADQNRAIGFCVNQNEYDDPWITPAHVYSDPNGQSEVLFEIWGGKGTWFTLLDQVDDDWLKVSIFGVTGYIRSTGITIFRTDTPPDDDIYDISCGIYHIGRDIPSGLYLFSGPSSSLTVFSDYYTEGFHTYHISYDRYPLYLPHDSRIELKEGDRLKPFIPLNPFDKSWRCYDNVRVFFPFEVPIGNGETIPNSYTCTLLNETSYIIAYDILGNPYTIDIANVGEPFQIILNEGSFVEIYNCILEGSFNRG
ncbi:MAG: SH3 domain-containing protein [Acidaminococcaceae bacterium]|nr:SH3 domain-containing protein [Acidaminococcaceae bacterium]